MITKEIFIAFDGKEFDDITECEEYENSKYIKYYGKSLKAYDEEGNLLPLNKMAELVHSVYYLDCKTDEAANFISEQLDFYGNENDGIEGKGKYYFYDGDTWYPIEDAIEQRDFYTNIVNILEGK